MTDGDPHVQSAHWVANELLAAHGDALGQALEGYRGHVHRVIEITSRQVTLDTATAQSLGIAAFFHDSGIWMDDTFDYLPPSIERAREHLGPSNPSSISLVASIIEEHHRMRPAHSDHPVVEAFRRADLTDLTFGVVRSPGTSLKGYRSLVRKYPASGFRRRLLAIFVRWASRHPLRPLPMMKW